MNRWLPTTIAFVQLWLAAVVLLEICTKLGHSNYYCPWCSFFNRPASAVHHSGDALLQFDPIVRQTFGLLLLWPIIKVSGQCSLISGFLHDLQKCNGLNRDQSKTTNTKGKKKKNLWLIVLWEIQMQSIEASKAISWYCGLYESSWWSSTNHLIIAFNTWKD